jgi:SAM-dependent methyltransferase
MPVVSSSSPTDPPPTADKQGSVARRVRSFYEACSFPGYDDTDSPQALAAKAERSVFAKLLDEQLPSRCRVLDAGCGTGQLTLFLSMTERRVFGIDFSRAALLKGAWFRRRFGQDSARFCQMDLLRPALRDRVFDYVICTGVLHHTADPYAGFRELCRVVKPGGYLVIGLYNRYARLPLDLRRVLFRLTRGRLAWLDFVMRQRGIGESKKAVWYKDQYENPHETKMTVHQVLGWFEKNGVDYVNSIPNIRPGSRFTADAQLFEPQQAGRPLGWLLTQLKWIVTNSREGGLFIIIGRMGERSGSPTPVGNRGADRA